MFLEKRTAPTVESRAEAVTAIVNAKKQLVGLKFNSLTEYEGQAMSIPMEVTFEPEVGKALMAQLLDQVS